jgi:hypothetical protein
LIDLPLLLLLIFLFNFRFLVSTVDDDDDERPCCGFEGSGTRGFVTSEMASPVALMLMTALVMTIGLLVEALDLCSSL